MNLLLDTHALLWWLSDDPALSEDARSHIANPENTDYLSAVAVLEIPIKQSIGKLELPGEFRRVLDGQPFVPLAFSIEHAYALEDLPMAHRDPFGRMLVAQAIHEGMTIVTRDPAIAAYDVRTLAA